MPRTREAQDRHNIARRRCRAKARQAMFCMGYIEATHTSVFKEATDFFTLLDSRYPDKTDLTKTDEYKTFKKTCNGEELPSGELFYFDVKTGLATLNHPEGLQAAQSSPEIPDPVRFETVESSSSNQSTTTNKEVNPQLQIPLMTQQQVSKAMVSTQDEREMPTTSIGEIPEMVSTQDEQEMPTTSIGEIPDKIIDEIIAQLKGDPDLYNMFQDLEFQTEFEALGEDLDIPQATGSEKEPWW